MVTPRHWWRDVWDPESEVLVLTLASCALAGLGLALILIGALPAKAPARPGPVAGVPVAADLPRPATTRPDPTTQTRPTRTRPDGTRPAGTGPAEAGPGRVPTPAPAPPKIALGRAVPLTLDIPAIGVHSRLMSLGLAADGTVEVPPLKGDAPAGWYRNRSAPGEPGPAVILGHVDSARDGPAVFYRLRELRRGDRISVDRADGRTARFTVRSVVRYPKRDFPTEAVYGARPGPELRLVTCGGSFDTIRRHYRDNVVVYATMTGSSPAQGSRIG